MFYNAATMYYVMQCIINFITATPEDQLTYSAISRANSH